MGLEIDHGYQLSRGLDPFHVLRQARELLEPIRRELDFMEIADRTTDMIVLSEIQGTPFPSGMISTAANALADDIKEGSFLNFHRCQIGITSDPETGIYYFLLFGHKRYAEAFATLPGISDYSYYEFTEDIPAGIPQKDWETRGMVWKRLINTKTRQPVSEAMPVWSLHSDNYCTHALGSASQASGIIDYLPSSTLRARRILVNLAIRHLVNPEDVSVYAYTSAYSRANRFISSGQADDIIAMVENLIAPTTLELYLNGQGTSLLHANLDRVEESLARAFHQP